MSAPSPSRAARFVRPTAILAWATAAALGGSIVWWAVAAIGTEGAAPTVFTEAQVARLAAEPLAPGAPGATATSSGTPPPAVSPSPTSTPLPEPTTTPSAAPTASSSPRPSPVPVRPSTTPPPVVPPPTAVSPTAVSPTATAVARTWNVPGGQVSVECQAAEIVLLSATPENGWSVEVEHGGPVEIEVKFHQREAETSVHAVCVGGVPEMTAEARGD